MGTGYQSEKKIWVPMGTGYQQDKKLLVPMGTRYQQDKNFCVEFLLMILESRTWTKVKWLLLLRFKKNHHLREND